MKRESCFELGKIIKPHGLKGEISISLDVDDTSAYQKMESVFVEISQRLVPFFIKTLQILDGDKAIVRFEECNSVEEAFKLRGCKLFLPLDKLPTLADDQYYYHEVTGYRVVDEQKGPLGTVDSIVEFPNQLILIMHFQEKEVLIPLHDHVVKKVDKAAKEFLVTLPDGLLEIYLEE